jgi:hypothetical protein
MATDDKGATTMETTARQLLINRILKINSHECDGYAAPNHIDTWIESGLGAKQPLLDMLGLDETNSYRHTMPVYESEQDARNRLPNTYQLIRVLAERNGYDAMSISLVSNSIDDNHGKRKLSRVLLPLVQSFHDSSVDEALDYSIWLHSSIELGVTDIKQFGPKFGEAIAQRIGSYVTVSANPLDFIAATYNCNYMSSCYKPTPYDHDSVNYHNACLAYWLDTHTLMSYVTNEIPASINSTPYKIGRAWLHVILNGLSPCIVYGREYNSIHGLPGKLAREYIYLGIKQLCFADDIDVISSSWKYTDAKDYVNIRYGKGYAPIYTNDINDYSLVYYITGHKPESPILTLMPAMCFTCGCRTDTNKSQICSDCANVNDNSCICWECDNRFNPDDGMYIDYHDICSYCVDEYYRYCDTCNEYVRRNDYNDDNNMCEGCFNESHSECPICTIRYVSDHGRDIGIKHIDNVDISLNGYICPDCYDTIVQHMIDCDNCGSRALQLTDSDDINQYIEYTPIYDIDSGQTYCSEECLEEWLMYRAMQEDIDIDSVLQDKGEFDIAA